MPRRINNSASWDLQMGFNWAFKGLTRFLRKPRVNAEAILKTNELFIYGNGSF
jgi:hypothetical protein